MLNENLARIRKNHGLTQEALAIKLNVVRQTVSKWEKGTAVPDADTLCRIAQALEVPVSELLGEAPSASEERIDTALLAAVLAEINEQLAIKNRRASRVLRILLGAVAGLPLGLVLLVVLNLAAGEPTVEETVTVHAVTAEAG